MVFQDDTTPAEFDHVSDYWVASVFLSVFPTIYKHGQIIWNSTELNISTALSTNISILVANY